MRQSDCYRIPAPTLNSSLPRYVSDDEGDIDDNYHTELDYANNHAELEDTINQVELDTPTTVSPANLPEPPMIPSVISAPPPHLPSVASNPSGTDDSDNISPLLSLAITLVRIVYCLIFCEAPLFVGTNSCHCAIYYVVCTISI